MVANPMNQMLHYYIGLPTSSRRAKPIVEDNGFYVYHTVSPRSSEAFRQTTRTTQINIPILHLHHLLSLCITREEKWANSNAPCTLVSCCVSYLDTEPHVCWPDLISDCNLSLVSKATHKSFLALIRSRRMWSTWSCLVTAKNNRRRKHYAL